MKDLTCAQKKKLGRHIETELGYNGKRTPTDLEINEFVWYDCETFIVRLKAGLKEEDEE